MKKKLKENKKMITIIGGIILLLIIVILIYKIFFSGSNSDRYSGINSHKLTKTEITNIKNTVHDIDKTKNVKVYTNSKIIRIFVNLAEDVEFDIVKEVANKTISKIDKKNLEFYDVEFFVQSKDDSAVYPKIGYKHKSSDSFVW